MLLIILNGHQIKKRIKQYPKVNYELMIQIQDWILKHPNVIHSPITADTLLIKDESGKYFQFVSIWYSFTILTIILIYLLLIGKKTKRVGKLLLQTSVRELHNDLIKSEKLGGLPSVWNNKNF